jgi:D-alanyl-D-alanine carboxypeptidase/D-alanyl-D-alanine-endopeptidase (penicillin-binding protein 4)
LVFVVDGKGNDVVAQNADEPFVPASVTKIVTAWLAMEVLGGDYRFETRFYLDDKRLLYVRGGGDPFLVSEELALLANDLVAGCWQNADHRHGARRELLPFKSPHPGHRGHRRGL